MNELSDLKTVFDSIMQLMNYEMVIFGYRLTLWQFFVCDVVLVGFCYMIGRSFFDND